MKRLKHVIFLAIAIVGLSAAPLSVSHATVNINDAKTITGAEACKTQGNKEGCSEKTALSSAIVTVTNVLLFLVGAVAVIMLIVGGLRYVTSNGDQNAVTGAKNTILYAIIGIVVAFLAYAAVQFIVGSLTGTGTKGNAAKTSSIHKTAVV